MTNGILWRSHLMAEDWFGRLPAGLQDALIGAAVQRRVTPGKRLFAKGDAPCGLYLLLEGAVRMGAVEDQRLTSPRERARLPYWFGEVSLFDGLPRTHNVHSIGQSIFLQVPQAFLHELFGQHPEYLRFFAALLSLKLGLPLLRPERLQTLPERARVAWRLLLLSEGYGLLNNARRLIGFEAIEACPTVSLPRPALRQVLEDLHQRKIIRLGSEQVEVFDVARLRKVANHLRARAVG